MRNGLALVVIALLCVVMLRAQSKTFTNSVGVEFVLVPAGEFDMGCSAGDDSCSGNEKPRHHVKITKSFYIGKYEITQGQWKKVMGTNPAYFASSQTAAEQEELPVEQVSWESVQRFLQKLGELDKSHVYRLPTEAEWEYAARAGSRHRYQGTSQELAGWYWSNSRGETHPVGQSTPNAWGLYDMLGNVWEWCEDWYDKKYYEKSPSADPPGPKSGKYKVIRGSSWYWSGKHMRASFRYYYETNYFDYSGGFRVVAEPVI